MERDLIMSKFRFLKNKIMRMKNSMFFEIVSFAFIPIVIFMIFFYCPHSIFSYSTEL